MNSTKMDSVYDMGKDADATFTVNLNRYVASDQFGYSLTYYDTTGHTDYTAINGGGNWGAQNGSSLQSSSANLWNGNIKNMVTSIRPFMSTGRPQGRAFQYDQLNRIISAQVDTNFVVASNAWSTSGNLTSWQERFTYDENGNITKLVRHGKALTEMDSLDYSYNAGTNQLNYVTDGVADGNYADDIDTQLSNNYSYDKIGNLVGDVSEEIDTIKWNVYGKIEKVVRTDASLKSDLEFHYDAMGNRICKIVKPRAGSGILTQENWTYTYYLRDAQGNVLATYDRTFRSVTGGFTEKYNLKENDLYGSSRTGIRNTTLEVASVALTTSGYNGDGTINVTAVAAGSGTALSTTIFNHTLGEKSYELSNHLGNVLVTVSDKKLARDGNSDGTVDYYTADVISANDYFAFGSSMPGRSFNSTATRYGFNGKEKDDEITGSTGTDYDFGARIYDARLGRWLSTDPHSRRYPAMSPYAFANDNPIYFIDPDGGDVQPFKLIITANFGLGTSYQYPGFESKEEGEAFFQTWKSLYITNKAYRRLYDYLEAAPEKVRITGSSNLPAGEMGETKWGVIQLNTNLMGHTSKSTVFEESAHAGQEIFYNNLRKSQPFGRQTFQTQLQGEVEAKAIWAISGTAPTREAGLEYEYDFYNDPRVAAYRDSYLAGKEIDATTQQGFNDALTSFASTVYDVYNMKDKPVDLSNPSQSVPQTYDPTAPGSLDFFKFILKPIVPEAKAAAQVASKSSN